jgi:hypothetical protein
MQNAAAPHRSPPFAAMSWRTIMPRFDSGRSALRFALAVATAVIASSSAGSAFAASITVTARDAGGGILATTIENVPLGTDARPVRLGADAFVPVSIQDAGPTTCAGGSDDVGHVCLAGAAREWDLTTGAVANLPDAAALTLEVAPQGELCSCDSTFAEEQCCGGLTFVATGSAAGGTHALRFVLPPPSAGCKIPIDGGCQGAACASVVTDASGTFLQLADTDGNGRCEWPEGGTSITGTLRIPAPVAIELSGTTAIRADDIAIDAGAALTSVASTQFDAFAATDVSLIARNSLTSNGRLEVLVADDLVVQAQRGNVALLGPTTLRAPDHLTIQASAGDVTIAAPPDEPGDVFGGNAAAILARGASGAIAITGPVHVGAQRRLTVSNRTNVSVVGPKEFRIADGVVLTTDQQRTGKAGTTPSDVELRSSGPIVVSGNVLIDSGRNVTIRSDAPNAQICLFNHVAIEATKPEVEGAATATGRIFFPNRAAPVGDDGTTTFAGEVRGAVQPGICGPAPTPTSATPVVVPTPSPTIELARVQWLFYVRVARTSGTDTNVHVPGLSTDAPIVAAIASADVARFRTGDQVPGATIATNADTLARLTAAAADFIASHPDEYPGFASIVGFVWAERVEPVPSFTPSPTSTPAATATVTVQPRRPRRLHGASTSTSRAPERRTRPPPSPHAPRIPRSSCRSRKRTSRRSGSAHRSPARTSPRSATTLRACSRRR